MPCAFTSTGFWTMSTPTWRTNLSFDRMTEVACLSPYPWSRIYSAMRRETIVATSVG